MNNNMSQGGKTKGYMFIPPQMLLSMCTDFINLLVEESAFPLHCFTAISFMVRCIIY